MILRGSTLHGERLKLGEHGATVLRPVTAAPVATIVSLPPPVEPAEPCAPLRWSATQVVEAIESLEPTDRETVLAAFAEDLAALRSGAIEAGRIAGERQGREMAERALADRQRAVDAFMRQVEEQFARERAQLEDACVDIVAEAITRLAGSVLTTPEALLAVVHQVAQQLPPSGELRVRVHPQDAPALEPGRGHLAAILPARLVQIVPDETIGLGGCIVECASGQVDARWERQLGRMCESLRIARSSAAPRS